MPQGSTPRSGADQLLYEAYRRGWINERTYQRARNGAQNLAAAGQQFAASPMGQAVLRTAPLLTPQAALLEAARLGLAGPVSTHRRARAPVRPALRRRRGWDRS